MTPLRECAPVTAAAGRLAAPRFMRQKGKEWPLFSLASLSATFNWLPLIYFVRDNTGIVYCFVVLGLVWVVLGGGGGGGGARHARKRGIHDNTRFTLVFIPAQ